jgi:hypothetical protein
VNPHRFRRSGRFAPKPLAEAAPLIDAILRAKSRPHCDGWKTRKAKRSAERWAHIDALRASFQ